MNYFFGVGNITFELGSERIEYLRFGKVRVKLESNWLGFTRRKASILKGDGDFHFIGEIYGDGDIREPFFRYLGGA
jgi:hypothetical protein